MNIMQQKRMAISSPDTSILKGAQKSLGLLPRNDQGPKNSQKDLILQERPLARCCLVFDGWEQSVASRVILQQVELQKKVSNP
jgi:hypothetical protein